MISIGIPKKLKNTLIIYTLIFGYFFALDRPANMQVSLLASHRFIKKNGELEGFSMIHNVLIMNL